MTHENSLMQALYEASPLAVVVVVADGRIRHASTAVEETFGYKPAELLGQSLDILLPERYRHAHGQWLQLYFAQPRQRSMGGNKNLLARRKDGREFPVEIGLSSFAWQGETAAAAYITDITARVQAEKRLAQYAQELEARNAELDAYAHTVAHGLKTPLSLIAGYGELLTCNGKGLLPAEKQRMMQVMTNQTLRMSEIVHDLLLLSGAGQTEIDVGPLDMAAIVSRTRGRLAGLAKKHDVEITLPQSWVTAVGYAPWIEEVWDNYLSNGMKYGGTAPRLTLGSNEQADGMARFWVRDNGSGIAPDDQERLFTPFTRLNLAHTEGHGLGLSIVQRIVERSGGEVGVESYPGEGSTFWFTLPTSLPKTAVASNGSYASRKIE